MASESEDVAAARQVLGARLRAWRVRAGLTQQALAHRTGYSRTSIAAAEAGEPRSGALFQAADGATGAEGALAAAYAETAATIAAIRQRSARSARAGAAGIVMMSGWLEDTAVAVQDRTCPACQALLTVTSYTLATLTLGPP